MMRREKKDMDESILVRRTSEKCAKRKFTKKKTVALSLSIFFFNLNSFGKGSSSIPFVNRKFLTWYRVKVLGIDRMNLTTDYCK